MEREGWKLNEDCANHISVLWMKLSKKVYAYYITIVTNKAWLEHSTGLVRYTARWYCLAFYFPANVKGFLLRRLSNWERTPMCLTLIGSPLHENWHKWNIEYFLVTTAITCETCLSSALQLQLTVYIIYFTCMHTKLNKCYVKLFMHRKIFAAKLSTYTCQLLSHAR